MPLAVGHQPAFAAGMGCFLCPACAQLAMQPPLASCITHACTQALLSLLGALPPNPARSLRTCTGPPRHAAHAPTVCLRPASPLAVDCARVLLKPVDDLAQTDICSHAVEQLRWV